MPIKPSTFTATAILTAATLTGCQNRVDREFSEGPLPEHFEARPVEIADADNATAEVDFMPAQPHPAETAPLETISNTTYTIRKGDTLWSIAKRTYNDGHRWRDIVAANPGLQPKKLSVGQEILLP